MPLTQAIRHAACAVALVVFTSVGASAQVLHLVMQSQSGDSIGLGQDYNLVFNPATTPGDDIYTSLLQPPGTNALPDYLDFTLDKNDAAMPYPFLFGFLDFSTGGLNVPLAMGTYTNAQRAGFEAPGHPGLDVSFDGRGSNQVTGNFTITDYTYSTFVDQYMTTTYTLNTFAATFEQHSEGRAPGLFGTITYSANGPAAVPEASTTVSFGLLLALGTGSIVIAARKRKSAA